MIDLPMMGQAGIPPATTYYPPAPQRAGIGGLGGLGGKVVDFVNSGDGNDIIRALGYSLMSSPGNHWLRDFGTHHSNLRSERRADEKEARGFAKEQQEREALIAYSLHNHADMQRLFGKQDQAAALVPFEMAQNCLRKAVKSLEIAMRNTARDAIGPLSPEEAGTGESFH